MSIDLISRSDIKDTIIGQFDLADYLTETNDAVIDLAESLGVCEDCIDDDPIHNTIKRYAIAYCLMRLCQDKMGTNSTDMPEQDRYFVKYNIYKNEAEQLRKHITYEMMTGNVQDIRDRAIVSGTMYRG